MIGERGRYTRAERIAYRIWQQRTGRRSPVRLERIYPTASQGTRLYMRRHEAWCAAVAPRLVELFKTRPCPLRREVIAEGVKALEEAGYRSHTQLRGQRSPEGRVRDLMRLPAIQQNLEDQMREAGFGVDRVAQIMAQLAEGDFDDAAKAGVQLKAIELRMKLTTGFAPTKSANMHAHTRSDNFFDDGAYAKTPPIDVTPEDDA